MKSSSKSSSQKRQSREDSALEEVDFDDSGDEQFEVHDELSSDYDFTLS